MNAIVMLNWKNYACKCTNFCDKNERKCAAPQNFGPDQRNLGLDQCKYCSVSGGDSNDATCAVIQVICITLLSSEYIDSRILSGMTAKFTAIDPILGQQQCFACYGIQMTWMTAQVASCE